MANLPLRRLGDIGIITDVSPFDLPPNALSQGSNIRCANGKISRAPVCRTVLATTAATPVFTWVYNKPGEDDLIGIADRTGTLYFYSSSGEVDVTPSSYVPAASDSPHTDCVLANVNYINRDDAVPMYYNKSSTDFDELPNWDSTWRCKSLRAYRDALVAINVTKGATNYPNMVKTSDLATIDSVPASWDESDQSNSAYENTINECRSPLLDGLALRDAFILYSEDQTFVMVWTGDTDIYQIRKLFENVGVVNTNCVVEVEGKHYVFGRNDIYVHDGVAFQSIIEGRNKRFVFDNLILDQSHVFHVKYNPHLREIMFCFVSGDGYAEFTETTYCNRAAAYNIDNGTWTFRDLPNVGVGCYAALSQSETYASITTTYETAGGSYASYESSAEKAMFFPSPVDTLNGLTDSRLYGYDLASSGHLTHAISTEATAKAWAERVGIDLDETQTALNAYKVVRTIFPQANSLGESGNLQFKFAGMLYPNPDATPSWTALQSFDPTTDYKIDVPKNDDGIATGGRYLGWYVENATNFGFELGGFDADIVVLGRK
jgi:hypothetical protein